MTKIDPDIGSPTWSASQRGRGAAVLDRVEAAPTLRSVRQPDGSAMWRLALDSGVLEENSEYVYHMFCHFFSDTCVVAEADGRVVGFVAGLLSPKHPDTAFVWQIAVDHEYRGQGLAGRMLAELMRRNGPQVRFLEATVTPSNHSSRRAFEGFARAHCAECHQSVLFPADLFAGPCDENEVCFRIGPLDPESESLRLAAEGRLRASTAGNGAGGRS